MRRKITVVGAGDKAAAITRLLAERDYADVVLSGEGDAERVALDIAQAGPLVGYEPRVTGAPDFTLTAGSDIAVLATAPTRDAVGAAAREIAVSSPDAVIVVATDNVDAMCHVVLAETLFPRQRVVGMAGVLASSRLRAAVASELGVSARDAAGLVLGGAGEAMVPVLSLATVGGAPVTDVLDAARLAEIVAGMRDGDAAAVHAPAAAVREMIDAVVFDRRRVLPCSALCQGEYGIEGLFAGVPVRLGAGGIEEIVEITLAQGELEALRRSADAVRELVDLA